MEGSRRPRQRPVTPAQSWAGPGGLRLIVREDHSSPITAVTACFLGGVRCEDRRRQGLSYFTQRLAPRGTSRRSAEQVAEDFEYLGASLAPFASKDLFGASLTLLTRHFGPGLELLVECLRFPSFPAEEVEREQRNLLLDLARRREDPLAWARELSEQCLYRRHPYRFGVRGEERSVASWTRELLVDWHSRTFTPDRLVVSVVGDQRPGAVARQVLDAFEGFLPSGWSPRGPALEPPLAGRRLRTARSEARQAALCLAFPGPRFGTEEADAMEVLYHVLSGMGSRLFLELREREGLAYSVNCSLDPRYDSACFKVYTTTDVARLERARRAILRELDRLRQEPVPPGELNRAKKHLLGLFEIQQQRKATQAFRLAMCEQLGAGYQAVDDFPRRIRAVTPERAQQVAQRFLDVERYAWARVLPSARP